LRAIFGWISKGKLEEAKERINEAYLTFLRNDAAFFHGIPEEKLTEVLLADHNFTHGHLEVLAGLLHAEASLNDAMGESGTATGFFRKSLKIYEFLEVNDRTWSPERNEIVTKIRQRLTLSGDADTGSLA